jgi:hypothetical protein
MHCIERVRRRPGWRADLRPHQEPAGKHQFTQEFQKQNFEREKAGLPKLDWCAECYKFSRSRAMDQPGCAERIRRYEAGEAEALSM